MALPYPTKSRTWDLGTSANGTFFDTEFNQLYANDVYLLAQIASVGAEFGLGLANNSGKSLAVSAGACWDVTRSSRMVLGAFTGSLAGTWVVGTGQNKLDTGTVANSTTYHVFVIGTTGGTVDILFSTSASSPTMPNGYTLKRRIGSLKTDGSGDWVLFTQAGNYFALSTPPQDVAATNPGTAAVTRTLSCPTGIIVLAELIVGVYEGATAGVSAYLSSLACADVAAVSAGGATQFGSASVVAATPGAMSSRDRVLTNTSAQIRSRLSSSGGGEILLINTVGWTDLGIVGLG